jgi:hypothetical protein
MGARHRVGIGLLYRPARLHRLAEFIPWNRFRGPIHVQKYQLSPVLPASPYISFLPISICHHANATNHALAGWTRGGGGCCAEPPPPHPPLQGTITGTWDKSNPSCHSAKDYR